MDDLTGRLADEARPAMAGMMTGMMTGIEAMLEAAQSFDEFREMLLNDYPELDAKALAGVLSRAPLAAELGGRAELAEEAGG
ncbi:MAG: DUF935 family protein [Rhodobacterales bacterium]|nr:DUF935 family protein [Rhodobacterales bacterium]